MPTDTSTPQADLASWVARSFRPSARGRRRYRNSSYEIKHVAERQIGRYVPETELKAAMLAAGYPPVDPRETSWCFRISVRRPEDANAHAF